ncbi:MFS transporter [Nonomuraea endophytica]|uniref:MFS transporter n=1 Tax=Nonomuraea endophytica TaxID=714136 RepID=UPI0037CC4DF3
MLAFGGMFGAFTYIAFILTEVTGFAAATVPWLLVLFGVGTFAGNYVGGKLADRALNPSLAAILAALTVVLAVFALTAGSKPMTVLSLLLMGAVGLATAPGLQVRIMSHAQDAPTLASGANIAAFNVGNALGAWLGGLALAGGLGFVAPLWVGAAVTAAGLVVLAFASVRLRRQVASIP